MRFAVVRGCTAAQARLEPTNRAEQPLTRTVQPTHTLDRSIARKNRGFGPFAGPWRCVRGGRTHRVRRRLGHHPRLRELGCGFASAVFSI